MKLFGNKHNVPEMKGLEDDHQLNEKPEQLETLVLDIEGLKQMKQEESKWFSLKTDTQELPQPDKIAEAILGESPQDESAEGPDAEEGKDAAAAEHEAAEAEMEAAPAEAAEETSEAPEEEIPEAPAEETAEAPEEEIPEAPAEEPAEAPEEESFEASEEETVRPLASVSYESVAQAVKNAQQEPTGRFSRDAIDDETLLAELYALIGDQPAKPMQNAAEENAPKRAEKPVARITPETLQSLPDEPEELPEEDAAGVPGWLKGVFILLLSLLLSAMTFYAVASDLIGKIF